MRSFTGHTLTLLGKTEILVDGMPPMHVDVVQGGRHELIIGDKTFRKGKSIIDYDTEFVTMFGKKYPMLTEGAEVSSFDPILPEMHGERIKKVVLANSDVFANKKERAGYCDVEFMEIDTGSSEPIAQKPYRAPLTKRKMIEEEVASMLKMGIIRPSSSPWASPVTLVPKKDGTTRFCIDYRKLNAVTKKDRYPLPRIQDIFDQLEGAKIFSTLDLKSGYWQIPMHENSIEKTAFICHLGLFEFLMMPFGCANCPSKFQRALTKVLSGLIGKICMLYIDDIVIYGKDERSHARNLQLVFDRLRKAGLKLKPSKCHFGATETKLLGYVVGKDGIKPDHEKVCAIRDLPNPKTVTEVQSFLGMTGYYRQCMAGYAKISEPLVALTRKANPFVWGASEQTAFDDLKLVLMSEHVMAHPRVGVPYKLYTDACNYAVGAILVQTDNNGIERVIQYISHQLKGSQRKWATIEKEAYAVVYALKKLRPYLYGADFTVYTDHKPLTCLFTKEMNNTKIQRWAVLLAEFGATIQYRKGKNNIRADMLSRIRSSNDLESEVSTVDTDDWIDVGFLEEEPHQQIPLLVDGLRMDNVRQEQLLEFPELFEEAHNEESEYEIHKGVLYSIRKPSPTAAVYPRLVLPSRYRSDIVSMSHKDVGHMSVLKTMDRIREAYVWPGMRRDVQAWVKSCAICSVHVRRRENVAMGEMPFAIYPMQIVGMDLIGPFVETDEGYKYALTMVDHFSGWAEAYPLKHKRYHDVFDVLRKQFFPRHGYPEIMICDNGGEFTAKELKDYLRGVGVDQRVTTPYHPMSNGKSERLNKTLKEMLARMVNGKRGDWEERLGEALMAHRNSVSGVTGYTPFFLTYGRRGRLPLTRMLTAEKEGQVRPFGSRLHELSTALNIAKELTMDSRKYNRERLQAKANAGAIEVGDTVMVAANEPLTLTAKWDPEYEVTRVVGTTCWVRHQTTGKQLKVHREKLRLVDPDASWDDVRERPRRQRIRVPVVLPDAVVVPKEGVPPQAGTSVAQDKEGEGRSLLPKQAKRKRRPPPVHMSHTQEPDRPVGAVAKLARPDTVPIGQDSAVALPDTGKHDPININRIQQALDAEDELMLEPSSAADVNTPGVASRTRSKRSTLDWNFLTSKRGRRT